jgi:hypothetical protein
MEIEGYLLVPLITKPMQPLINLVDKILAAKQQPPHSPFVKGEDNGDADTSALEHQIDKMVYELYGLTPEEVAIVEGKR